MYGSYDRPTSNSDTIIIVLYATGPRVRALRLHTPLGISIFISVRENVRRSFRKLFGFFLFYARIAVKITEKVLASGARVTFTEADNNDFSRTTLNISKGLNVIKILVLPSSTSEMRRTEKQKNNNRKHGIIFTTSDYFESDSYHYNARVRTQIVIIVTLRRARPRLLSRLAGFFFFSISRHSSDHSTPIITGYVSRNRNRNDSVLIFVYFLPPPPVHV